MNDDLVTEEEQPGYRAMLTMLQSSSRGHKAITVEEQAQIVEQVRKRLASTMSASPLHNAHTATLPSEFRHRSQAKQARQLKPWIARSLAALVMIGLICSAWLLFSISPSKTLSQLFPVQEPGIVAQTQFDGLDASMHVLINGPYFLSELLPVDVSLTNHAQHTIVLAGTGRTADQCFASALMVRLTEGSKPSFTFPKLDTFCTLPAFMTQVKPGQTLTISQYVPLTMSKGVTLTMGPANQYATDPLKGHWPEIRIQVNTHVDPDRALSLQSQGKQVTIHVPAGLQAHLLFMETITCGTYENGNGGQWTALSTNTLQEPSCPTVPRHWNYIVSAPGYAIVSGNQTDAP